MQIYAIIFQKATNQTKLKKILKKKQINLLKNGYFIIILRFFIILKYRKFFLF